jgi:ubiquitin-conjugating enzyme E2 W
MTHPFHKRLAKEFKELQKNKLPGVQLVFHDENLSKFIFHLKFDNKIYPDTECYHLSVDITKDYPVDSPRVQFILYDPINLDEELDSNEDVQIIEGTPKIPIHPHVYSNGHICLNLLGEDWTPACSIEAIVLSIQSMLANNDINQRPPDDDNYVKHAPKDPKLTNWYYHDDNV